MASQNTHNYLTVVDTVPGNGGTGLDGLGSCDLVKDYGVLGLLGGEGHAREGPEIGEMNTK